MTTRRRAANSGNPSELKRYNFRDRNRNAQPSAVRAVDPEPGSAGDVSSLVRPPIRNSARVNKRIVEEQNRTNRSTRRTAKHVTPDSDDNSDDASDVSSSSRHSHSDEDETRHLQSEKVRGTDPLYQTLQHEEEGSPQQIAKYTRPQQVQPIASSFSEDDKDDKEKIQNQRQTDFNSHRGKVEKINHLPIQKEKQKGNKKGTCMKNFVVSILLVLVIGSAAVLHTFPESLLKITDLIKLLEPQEPHVKKNLEADFKNLSSIFTNQSPMMWHRSRRILERHLENWKGNSEPAIILLTGALDAEQTLRCLGTQLADIYSSSINGSYTVISGSEWASEDNADVKKHIDEKLSGDFQATSRAAVLHRLELLPAGSLLILYKYCDHESAVFKNVMLLLTVLLEEETLEKDMPLTDLEEKVRDFLIHKLTDPDSKSSHDGMDADKFSGVWSRISHVVLPVFPEENTGKCAK